MSSRRSFAQEYATRALMAVWALWIASDSLIGAPAQPATAPTSEPKEFGTVSAGGGAAGYPFEPSGKPKCWPIPPGGAITISGGGEIRLGEKLIPSLVIGSGGSQKEFEWIAGPVVNGEAPTAWSCGGGAQLQKGYAYGVSVGFEDTTSPCGASTIVGKPASLSASGVFIWNDTNYTGGIIYIPRIKTATIATARSTPNAWRKMIGVGEEVTCTLEGAPPGATITWSISASAGGSAVQASGSSAYTATFTAGDEAKVVTLTANYTKSFPEVPGSQPVSGSVPVTFDIKEPTSVTAEKTAAGNIPAGEQPPTYNPGTQGVAMHLTFKLQPETVSFYRVEVRELSGPASRITGYFQNLISQNIGYTAASFSHTANPDWQICTQHNSITDSANFGGYPAPWSGGVVEWIIPLRWRVMGSTTERALPNITQTHEILDSTGRSKETKAGVSETRSP